MLQEYRYPHSLYSLGCEKGRSWWKGQLLVQTLIWVSRVSPSPWYLWSIWRNISFNLLPGARMVRNFFYYMMATSPTLINNNPSSHWLGHRPWRSFCLASPYQPHLTTTRCGLLWAILENILEHVQEISKGTHESSVQIQFCITCMPHLHTSFINFISKPPLVSFQKGRHLPL